jgi:hypothetical protein
MKKKYYYLELQESDKVVKRIPTSFQTEKSDRHSLQKAKKINQEILFIVSSTKEKTI